MKEFLMLIRDNPDDYGQFTPQEMQDDIERHVKWVEELTARGKMRAANPLSWEGRRISGRDRLVTDGPYIETKECVSGFFFLLAESLNEATALALECPSLLMGSTLEIREITELGDCAPPQ